MMVRLSQKQREVLERLIIRDEYLNGTWFTIGRSNGLKAAAYALERRGLVRIDVREVSITDDGRRALKAAQS